MPNAPRAAATSPTRGNVCARGKQQKAKRMLSSCRRVAKALPRSERVRHEDVSITPAGPRSYVSKFGPVNATSQPTVTHANKTTTPTSTPLNGARPVVKHNRINDAKAKKTVGTRFGSIALAVVRRAHDQTAPITRFKDS